MRIASFCTIRNHLIRNHKPNNSALYAAAAALAIIRFAFSSVGAQAMKCIHPHTIKLHAHVHVYRIEPNFRGPQLKRFAETIFADQGNPVSHAFYLRL